MNKVRGKNIAQPCLWKWKNSENCLFILMLLLKFDNKPPRDIFHQFSLNYCWLLVVTCCLFCQRREHVELENLRGEHSRMLEETKKEKVPSCSLLPLLSMSMKRFLHVHIFASSTSCSWPISWKWRRWRWSKRRRNATWLKSHSRTRFRRIFDIIIVKSLAFNEHFSV